MKQKFAEALKSYKKDVFKVEHDPAQLSLLIKDSLEFTEDALDNAYHYHFHKDEEPDPTRVETFNMIKNYTLESIMPPVLEKVMRRILVLEKQHESIVQLIDNLLEALSEDEGVKNSDRPAV